ncbi:MAG TPA: tRNA (adenosine(37)-N6)-threonylcarbamoyltransferase complex ATPase subunit type 1 TsaE [Candidatus Moranbacteria bacterium]|nr:tRNA (adenosine(37)-N6)-threonylcarbamoyltransferase complex ATPase subunit type 1 TsaE [Candidatus Moranbacteria bacterium]HBT46000.1 tRNA (adenosine(37)-N6)-threonylcarbamoyltransferase complex ATPase subunit type 1 TsaE [Candidatus Moranbacteria bacterium]
MLYEYITQSSLQTKKLGSLLAEELRGGEIICLSGDLGAGKTTFTQGLLKGLKIKGPYTSPTFSIMKHYVNRARNIKHGTKKMLLHDPCSMIHDIYHIDAYRITSKDLLELGFGDFAGKKNSITIIEWPEKVKKLIPTNALWINFQWLSEKERTITISTKKER